MPKFECEILFDGTVRAVLDTYAESMGWTVASTPDSDFVRFCGEGDNEEELLRDADGHIRFFNNEEPPAVALGVKIVRVVYDTITGRDEITETDDD